MNKDIKILVTGVKGQLGYDCIRLLKENGYKNFLGIDKDDLDLTNENKVKEFIIDYHPDVVIHNAAWTAVDKAELYIEEVNKINVLAPKYIAEACKEINATMVFISTDYVFSGIGETPFKVEDKKSPKSIYGKSKDKAEELIKSILEKYFIVRTSWVFGINGHNFIKTMLNLASSGKKELNVVNDQIGSPTYTYDLASLIIELINSDKYGIYHATNEGYCSWAELADYVFKNEKIDVKINYLSTEEYLKLMPNQAIRPLNSRLDKSKLLINGFNLLPSWQDAVNRYLIELKNKGV